jgi:hypothetical protein
MGANGKEYEACHLSINDRNFTNSEYGNIIFTSFNKGQANNFYNREYVMQLLSEHKKCALIVNNEVLKLSKGLDFSLDILLKSAHKYGFNENAMSEEFMKKYSFLRKREILFEEIVSGLDLLKMEFEPDIVKNEIFNYFPKD